MSRILKESLASAHRMHDAGFIDDARLQEYTALCSPPDRPQSQFSDEWAVCPYCHHEHGDCWDWVGGNTVETTCDGCGKPFSVEPDFSVTYRSYVPGDE